MRPLPRHLTTLLNAAALAMITAIASSGSVRAQEVHSCLGGRVRAPSPLPADFGAALDEACARLEGASDVDPSIVLTLRIEGSRVVVVASLADGRTALRHVGQADRLLEILEALAVLPVHEGPAPSQLVSSPELQAPTGAAPEVIETRVETVNTRLELGGTFGGRAFAAPAYAGVSVSGYAALRVRSWSLGLTMRWDPLVRVMSDSYAWLETSSLGVGFTFTRRWEPSERAAFDFGGAAGVDMQVQEYHLASTETRRTGTGARVGLLARTLVGRRACRFLSMLEIDVSPSLALHPIHVESGLPRLPFFSVGVSAGVAWSPG